MKTIIIRSVHMDPINKLHTITDNVVAVRGVEEFDMCDALDVRFRQIALKIRPSMIANDLREIVKGTY